MIPNGPDDELTELLLIVLVFAGTLLSMFEFVLIDPSNGFICEPN